MPLLRALGTLVTLSALVLLGDAGLSPTASAADSPSGTADIKLVIYENKTSDLSISIKISGLSPSNYCTEEHLGNEYDIKMEGDTCIIGAYGVGIDDMSGGSMTIDHRDDVFDVNMSDFSSFDDYESTSLTMVFPGKVTDADSNAKVDGNTAKWSDVVSLGSAHAEGKDTPDPTPTSSSGGQNQAQGSDEEDSGPSLLPLWILLGAVAVVAVTATVVVYAMNNSKKNQLAAQGAYPGAPQYTQYPTQPDYPVTALPPGPAGLRFRVGLCTDQAGPAVSGERIRPPAVRPDPAVPGPRRLRPLRTVRRLRPTGSAAALQPLFWTARLRPPAALHPAAALQPQ